MSLLFSFSPTSCLVECPPPLLARTPLGLYLDLMVTFSNSAKLSEEKYITTVPKIYRQRTIAYKHLYLGQVFINFQPGTSRNPHSKHHAGNTTLSPGLGARAYSGMYCGIVYVQVCIWTRHQPGFPGAPLARGCLEASKQQTACGSEVLRGWLSSGVPWGFCMSLCWLKGVQVSLCNSEHSSNQTQFLKDSEG